MSDQRRVVLGKVGAVHGVRGWVKLWSFTDPPGNLLDYPELEICREGRWMEVRLVEARPHGDGLVGRFAGVEDRDGAAPLVGAELAVRRDRLPPPEPGAWYWADLVGLEVVTREGAVLGKIEQMMATGANDVMVVAGERERLVPFIPGQFVEQVDLAGGRVIVDWDPEF